MMTCKEKRKKEKKRGGRAGGADDGLLCLGKGRVEGNAKISKNNNFEMKGKKKRKIVDQR